jgi:hypothetical protein
MMAVEGDHHKNCKSGRNGELINRRRWNSKARWVPDRWTALRVPLNYEKG